MTTACALKTALKSDHYSHLISEGFNPDEITELEAYGCRSITQTEALKLGIKKWNGLRHVSSGGLYFPFHNDYGQIRLDNPIESDGKKFKYLGPSKPARAWYPTSRVKAFTEGWKDAAMPSVRGIATGAIVGVDNIIYCVPKGCNIPIIFDSDGWGKPQVVRALVIGAIWTNGKINLFPFMEDYPTGGACEFFKSGNTISDYQGLIDAAMKPADFISVWISHWAEFDEELKADCARVAMELSHILQSPNKYLTHLQERISKKNQEWTAGNRA